MQVRASVPDSLGGLDMRMACLTHPCRDSPPASWQLRTQAVAWLLTGPVCLCMDGCRHACIHTHVHAVFAAWKPKYMMQLAMIRTCHMKTCKPVGIITPTMWLGMRTAAEFAELDKSYKVLLDEAAKGALDDWLKYVLAMKRVAQAADFLSSLRRPDKSTVAMQVRQQRNVVQGEKRRKMRDELDARERRVAGERNEEELARARLKAELDRLRQKAYREEAKAREAAASATAAAAASAVPPVHREPAGGEVEAQMRRSLKITWNPTAKNYSADTIRAALLAHGTVEDVVIKDKCAFAAQADWNVVFTCDSSNMRCHAHDHACLPHRRKKHKATAFAVMGSEEQAYAAANAVCGDLSEPLLVSLLSKQTSEASGVEIPEVLTHGRVMVDRPSPAAAAAFHDSVGPGPSQPLHPSFAASVMTQSLFPSSHVRTAVPPPAVASASTPLFPSAAPRPSAGAPTSGASSFPSAGFGSFPQAGSFPGGLPKSTGAFESAVLEKLKRESDRKRALDEAEAAEDGS
eukprot:365542-Chlamydomonas_euryale.AAC.40